MKLSRTQLKSLIKECIVEVLSEGLNGNAGHRLTASSTTPLTEARHQSHQPQRAQQHSQQHSQQPSSRRRSLAESMLDDDYDDDQDIQPVRRQPQQRRNLPAQPSVPATLQLGDPVMDSIFAHTAATTVVEQGHGPSRLEEAGTAVSTDPFARALAKHNPEDVFGEETASKWAKFAFPDGRVPVRGTSPVITEQAPVQQRRPEPEVTPSNRVVRQPPLDFDPYNPSHDD